MSTKNRLFSKKFSLTEHGGKYGIVKEEKTILHPVHTFSVTKKSILELYKILPIIMEDVKCNKSIVWNMAKQA